MLSKTTLLGLILPSKTIIPQTKKKKFTEKLNVTFIFLFGPNLKAVRAFQLQDDCLVEWGSHWDFEEDLTGYLLGLPTRNHKAYNFIMTSRI